MLYVLLAMVLEPVKPLGHILIKLMNESSLNHLGLLCRSCSADGMIESAID